MSLVVDDKVIDTIASIYGEDEVIIDKQIERYKVSINEFKILFKDNGDKIQLFSTHGRTEVGGNHTDHNFGRVLAAGINLDSIAVAKPNKVDIIKIYSKG